MGPGTCAVGADVQCPGSGNTCAGDQCCPGYAGSGGATFPCPSASSGFSGCVNNTKVSDCLSSSLRGSLAQPEVQAQGTCTEGADVQCPGSGNICAGDQCCPGYAGSGGGTFPCPSASIGFLGCVNNTKITNCVPGSLRGSLAQNKLQMQDTCT